MDFESRLKEGRQNGAGEARKGSDMESLTYLAIESGMIYRIRLDFGKLTLEVVYQWIEGVVERPLVGGRRNDKSNNDHFIKYH